MTAKEIEFGMDCLERIVAGVDCIARTVGSTLGPKGRLAVLEHYPGRPVVTKDGAIVAREIELADRFENMGAQAVREAALRTADTAGDGTTTTAVLARALIREGVKCVAVGMNPMDLRRGIDRGVDAAVVALRGLSRPCINQADVERIATISANGDTAIGEVIAQAFGAVGATGAITAGESRSLAMELEVIPGIRFDGGYISHYFATAEDGTCAFEDALVFATDARINSVGELLPLLDLVAEAKKPLLVLAADVGGEALAMLIANHLRGTLQVCAVKPAGVGERGRRTIEDVAVLTGARFIASDFGRDLRSVHLAELGRARRARIDKDRTTIIGAGGVEAEIKERVDSILAQLADAPPHERESLRQRAASLGSGVAVVKVGAASELEMREKQARVEDAISATRAAIEEGMLPGGGVALLRARSALGVLQGANSEEDAGIRVVVHALEQPLRQIVENAGEPAGVVVDQVVRGAGSYGYNAATGEYGDLDAMGIVDALKVVRLALQNAASVAGLLLTASAGVAKISEEADRTHG